jgi:hypothetical protein
MNPVRAGLLTACAAVLINLISGCVAVQFNDPNELSPEASAKLEQMVPTYQEAQLENSNDYIRAGSIDTFLCRRGLIGTVTDGKVIAVLRQKAQASGANGLTDVLCEPGPIDEIGGCVASIACQATMIKTVTPDTADK